MIAKRAEGARMSVSEYLRQLIQGKNPACKFEMPINDPEVLKIFTDLDTVSKDLNNIAARLNSGEMINDDLRLRVKNDLEDVNRMRAALCNYSQGETLKDKVLNELSKLKSE